MNNSINNSNLLGSLKTSHIGKWDVLLICLVFYLLATPFFSGEIRSATQLFTFIFLGAAYITKFGLNIPKKIWLIVVIVFILVFLQGLFFGRVSAIHLIRYPFIVVLMPYFIYRIYGIASLTVVADFIRFTSVIAIILWSLQHIVPGFADNLYSIVLYLYNIFPYDSWPRSMIIYTIDPGLFYMEEFGIYRNAGIFHEPGAFAFWINFAILIYLFRGESFFSAKNMFMILVLLTTISTAGYIQFFVIGLAFFLSTSRYNVFFKYAVLIAFLLASSYAWENLEFLKPKIQEHRETQMDYVLEGSYTTGRFMRLRKGVNAMLNSPIIGRGIATSSQEEDMYSALYIGNVGGFIGFVARYGLPIGILFFIYMFKGYYWIGKMYGQNLILIIGFFIAVMLGAIGQGTTIWNPFIQLLFFHGYLYKRPLHDMFDETSHKS